jgi:hypothetical protein
MKSFNTESKGDSEDDQGSKNDLGALQGDYEHIVSGEATSGLINDRHQKSYLALSLAILYRHGLAGKARALPRRRKKF